MVEKRCNILIFLFVVFAGHLCAQQFDFENDKKIRSDYNEDIEKALNNEDINKLRNIFDRKPELINSSSKQISKSKYLRLSGGGVPLFYDVVDRYLRGQCSYDLVQLIMSYKPSFNCSFNKLTPFYLILDYIARHKIKDCEKAEKLFYLFCNQQGFDINSRFQNNPPPLSFLLSSNYNYLSNTYSEEYISFSIIRTFVEKGASINTSDENNNNLITYAIRAKKQQLFSYCMEQNADFTQRNNLNKDVLSYAILEQDYKSVSLLLDKKYPLSGQLLMDRAYEEILQTAEPIKELLFDKLKTGYKTLQDITLLSKLFSKRKIYFINENYNRNNYKLTQNQIPDFIDLFVNIKLNRTDIAFKNIQNLKKEYIYSHKTIADFVKATNKYPELGLQIQSFNPQYYKNESNSLALQLELGKLKKIIPENLFSLYMNEIKTKTNDFYELNFNTNSIKTLVKLKKDFPNKELMINKKATQIINDLPTYTNHFNIYDKVSEIDSEIARLREIISQFELYRNNFIDNISVAEKRVQELYNYISKLNKTAYRARVFVGNLVERHGAIIKKIIEYGETPPYEIKDSQFLSSSRNTKYTIELDDISAEKTIYKDEYGNYSMDRGVFDSYLKYKSNSMDKTIRMYYVYDYLSISSFYSKNIRRQEKIIEYLENNLNAEWFKVFIYL